MDRERELMHKLLDGDADEEEQRSLDRLMQADPSVKQTFYDLSHAVRMLEQGERMQAPASFTAEAMKKLPQTNPRLSSRLREFLFGGRVLRWNVAMALATVVMMAVTFTATVHIFKETMLQRQAEARVLVRLTFYSPRARSVAIAGDFNKWKTTADQLRKHDDSVWSIDLKLQPGVYAYSFIVDGKTWVADPGAQAYQDDGFGSRNALMRVAI